MACNLKLRFKIKPISFDRLRIMWGKQEINAPKTKVMRINTTLDAHLTVAGETLECVDSFTYLGSVMSKDGSTQIDKNDFANLRLVWRSSV